MTHSTIAGNSLPSTGAQCGERSDGILTMTHSTIAGNSTGYQGGGVGNDSYYFDYTFFFLGWQT